MARKHNGKGKSPIPGEEALGKDEKRIRYMQDTLFLGKNLAPDQREWIYIFPQVTPAAIAPGTSTIAPLQFPVAVFHPTIGEKKPLYSTTLGG